MPSRAHNSLDASPYSQFDPWDVALEGVEEEVEDQPPRWAWYEQRSGPEFRGFVRVRWYEDGYETTTAEAHPDSVLRPVPVSQQPTDKELIERKRAERRRRARLKWFGREKTPPTTN